MSTEGWGTTVIYAVRPRWDVVAPILHRARPLLALVGHEGIEHEAAEVVSAGDGWERGIASYVSPPFRTNGSRSASTCLTIEHPGPPSRERRQGYLEVLTELGLGETSLRFAFLTENGRETPTPPTEDNLRNSSRLVWARRGLKERTDELRPRTVVLCEGPQPHSGSDGNLRPDDPVELLRAGVSTEEWGHSSHNPLPVREALPALRRWALSSRWPYPDNEQLLFANDAGDVVARVERAESPIARPIEVLSKRPESRLFELTSTANSAPAGALVSHAVEYKALPDVGPVDSTHMKRDGRTVVLDTSAVLAGIDVRRLHPEDEVIVSVASLFDGAGSTVHFTDTEGLQRTTEYGIVGHRINPLPLGYDAIYSLGGILHTLKKRTNIHPDLTRFDVYNALIAKKYGAILKTCFPERYKGLIRGLKVEKY